MKKRTCVVCLVVAILLLDACGGLEQITVENALNKNDSELAILANPTSYILTLYDKDHNNPEIIPASSQIKILSGEYILDWNGQTDRGIIGNGISCSTKFIFLAGRNYSSSVNFERNLDEADQNTFIYKCECNVQETQIREIEKPEVEDTRLHNVFQFEYDYMSTSNYFSYNYYMYDPKNYSSGSGSSSSPLAGYGFFYMHEFKIVDDLYLGLRFGYILTNGNVNCYERFVLPGFNLRYYFYQDWFVNCDYNLGINMSGVFSASDHNPSHNGGLPQTYYSFGVGKNLTKHLGVILKYNKPSNKIYGVKDFTENNARYPSNYSGEYYLDYMITLGVEVHL